ncbi:MAG TPA: DUF58 domain-containing protein [Planctomycetaceae bacterium]|nr:DUF58 domain-containing protein [Planctomycetaceae bacterium]
MSLDRSDRRVYADLRELVSLKNRLRGLSFLPQQPVQSLLSGRHASRLRGRGLNFEELRHYHSGDDVRSIDWKVTARTRQAHTRVFTEERDRPVLLVVDQRINMFFGSQIHMKSVTAAHLAALTTWKTLDQGDRIGGIVFNDDLQQHVASRRSQATATQLLSAIVKFNHQLSVRVPDPDSNLAFANTLRHATRLAAHNHLIVIISDFWGLDEACVSSLRTLSRHNDVLGMLVHDPLASNLPNSKQLVVSDGELQLDIGDHRSRQRAADATEGRIQAVLNLQQQFAMPILPISTAEEALPQLQKLLGGAR